MNHFLVIQICKIEKNEMNWINQSTTGINKEFK